MIEVDVTYDPEEDTTMVVATHGELRGFGVAPNHSVHEALAVALRDLADQICPSQGGSTTGPL